MQLQSGLKQFGATMGRGAIKQCLEQQNGSLNILQECARLERGRAEKAIRNHIPKNNVK